MTQAAEAQQQQLATDRAEGLLVACRAYVDGVHGLLDALEHDVYQAADRCWRLQDRQVQLRGGVLRSKAVVVQEALFQPDAEQHDLAESLEQWRSAVQSSAASAALQVKAAEQQLVGVVGRALDPADAAMPPGQVLALLDVLLGAHSSVAALRKRDLRGTLALLCQLAIQVTAAWRAAGGTDASNLLAGRGDCMPQEVTATLMAPPAEQKAGTLPPDAAPSGGAMSPGLAASLQALRSREAELLEELSNATDVLRFWSRRGEKAATGDEGGGREGDVPPMLAEAQAALWAACQTYDDEQAASDLRTRQLVCQRYRPTDMAALQAAVDDYADGERLPARPSLTYESEFVQERGWARARALQFLHDDVMTGAAGKLYQLRYLLLEAQLPPETATARQQLMVHIAEALLNGSTPPAAVPLLAEMLQQGLQRQGAEDLVTVSEQDKAHLVPMICHSLVPQPGGRVLLRLREGMGLVQSLLKPDKMLNVRQLAQFYDTLKMVVDSCAAAELPGETTSALLSPFDATRFAVLVCEQWGSDGGGGDYDGGGSMAAARGCVSMQQLLALAHASLVQPGANGVGMALLEGVLTLQPASFLGAALQLALTCTSEQGRRNVLAMLCRVPAELLPAPVVADALAQIAEAIDGNQLAPPFLPYELLGRLYRSPHVLRSMQLAVEGGPEAAAAEAAADSAASFAWQKLWTARMGSGMGAGSGGGGAGGAANFAARAASSSSKMVQVVADGSTWQMGAVGESSNSLVLLPLQPTIEPLAVLVQQVVGAVLSCLLRRAGTALDAATLSEELMQLLAVLLMPVAEQGAWLLEWLWSHLYQEALHPFLADASAAVDGAGGSGPLISAFLSCWASLPWRQATFHAAYPAALSVLRLHLLASSADGAAAVLLRELDFAPVLVKSASMARGPREQLMYSLGEEEEQEDPGDAADPRGRGIWAADLGLLALHACVLLPPQEQPEWLQQLLYGVPPPQQVVSMVDAATGEEDVSLLMRSPLSAALASLVAVAAPQQPLLPHLLAAANWQYVAACMRAEQAAAGATAAWLLLPVLLAPGSISGDVGARLVHAASLLGRGAVLAGSPCAAECAASAVTPLLLCTLCQGAKDRGDSQRRLRGIQQAVAAGTTAAQQAQADAQQAQQGQVVIPEGFPMELLADTVEGQQLLLLQQQERERTERLQQLQLEDGGGMGGSTNNGRQEQAAEGRQQQQQQQEQEQVLLLVEVSGCWSLTADQHAQLLQNAMLPLASSQATLALAASLQPESCPAELTAPSQPGSDSALPEWHTPALTDMLHAAGSAAAAAAAEAAGTGTGTGDHATSVAGIAALLVPLARTPLTILTSERLPFSNAELPLDTEAALYISLGPESGSGASSSGGHSGGPCSQPHRRSLHQTLTALLPGARRRAQQGELVPGTMDVHVLKLQLRLAVQAACKTPEGLPLAACVLRLLYACPALHTCAEAQQLSEGLLRFLATPEHDGGPLGQGASASAAATAGDPAATLSTVSFSAHSTMAEVVSLEAAGSVLDGDAQAAEGSGTPAGSSLHVAITAALGLPPAALLGLARGAAEMHAPLTTALAVEQLRQGTTVLPKDEWQVLVTEVLHVAVRADAEPAHPFDLVSVWLAALSWVADSRWRRLPSGPHQTALLEWLEALELRVVALRLAQPEDFWMNGGSPGGGSPNRLLSGAADRFKAMRHRLSGTQPPGEGAAAHSQPQAATPLPEGGSGVAHAEEEAQLGHKLRRGFRSLLGKSGGGKEAPECESASGKKRWGDRMRHRLARIGRGPDEAEQPLAEQAAGEALSPSDRPGLPYPGLGMVAEEVGSTAGSETMGHADAGHKGAGHAAEGGGSGTGQIVKQRLSSGIQAVGWGLNKVKTKLADRQGGAALDEVAGRDQDVAIRVGLAAFAVSAYIKSVLCPSLASRLGGTDSAGPGTPTVARTGYHHRQTSSLGSLQRLDAEYMRELDRVLEARSELDSLEVLAACPLLQVQPGRYDAFLRDAPLLLSTATGVEAFDRALQQLLFEPDRQLLAWM